MSEVLELPQPYLLFLGDTTEPGYAKTAFGLRDWAADRCVGEWSCEGATVTTGLPRLTPKEARARGARALADRCRQYRRGDQRQLDALADRGAGIGARHHQRHAHQAQRHAAIEKRGGAPRPQADRCAHAAIQYPDRHRPQALGQTPAHRRHRLRTRQKVHARSAWRAPLPSAAWTWIFARPGRPAS